jgi:uncharacterized membrane protein
MSTLGKGAAGAFDPAGISARSRQEDALVVAKRVFGDFELSDDELRRASEILWTFSGGAEYRRIMSNAMKKPKEPWDLVVSARRAACINSSMAFHCSSADMEKMALRTGAGLIMLGEGGLGKKIIEICPESSFGLEPVGKGLWLTVAQICLYGFMFGIIGFESILSGYMIFVVAAIIAVVFGVLLVWMAERPQWKLEHEEGEARHYLSALGKLAQGALPKDVFEVDGSLRGTPS